MNTTLRQLLTEIAGELADWDERMEPAASSVQLASLQADSISQLAYSLPADYLEVLAVHDGVDCNGIQLYASEPHLENNSSDNPDYLKRGFVEANLIWREYEPNKNYIFFGESGDKLYCHNLKLNQFEIVDRLTKALIYEPATFGTFTELLEQLLKHMLDRYGVEE